MQHVFDVSFTREDHEGEGRIQSYKEPDWSFGHSGTKTVIGLVAFSQTWEKAVFEAKQ